MNETKQDGKGNIIEQIIDNGDGTGVRTIFDETGNIVSEEIVDRPLIESTEQLLQVPQSVVVTIVNKLEDPSVNSVAKLKSALKEFLEGVVVV